MSVQKYKKSASCKSDSIYSFSQDVNLLQDYEYLLQKSAEEITKVKEQNQILEQQLASVQPFNNNQYSTFQFNKNDFIIEQLKQENADLKLKLETKTKANKKLKNKCKQFEQIVQENDNLKKDYQDLLREKINAKENKQFHSNAQGKGQFQLQLCNQQKVEQITSPNLNYKALEEAEKFLQDTKIQSSRVMRCQPPLTPKSQIEVQPLIINFADEHLQANLAQQEELIFYLSAICEKSTNYLNGKLQNNQILNFSKAYSELEKQFTELLEQNWILEEKNKIQIEQIKQLRSIIDSIDLKGIAELMNFYKNFTQPSLDDFEQIFQELDSSNQQLSKNCKVIQTNFETLQQKESKTTRKQIENLQDENKENQCFNSNKPQKQKVNSLYSSSSQHKLNQVQIVDQEEFIQLKQQCSSLFQQFEELTEEILQFENQQSNSVSKQDLFEILELFSDEISYRENASIKEQIIYQVKWMQEENESLKNRYLDLIYKVILNQIKTDQRRTELLVKNDPKLQEAMQWLLKPKKSFKISTIFSYCDTLIEMIMRKHNFAYRMSELHDIISMQMKVIYTLLQSLSVFKNCSEDPQNLMNEAIEDLRELNKRISNLPESVDDLKANISLMCTKLG